MYYVLYIKPQQVKTWGIYVYDCIIAKIILTFFYHIVCKQCNNVSIILFPLQKEKVYEVFSLALCWDGRWSMCFFWPPSTGIKNQKGIRRKKLESSEDTMNHIKKSPYVTFIVHVSHHINHNLYQSMRIQAFICQLQQGIAFGSLRCSWWSGGRCVLRQGV